MNEQLNNTGILLADLNETEIELAIKLYKLAGFKCGNLLGGGAKYIAVSSGLIGFNYGSLLNPITLHQLAFESGLNPDWADRVSVGKNTGDFYFEDVIKRQRLDGLEFSSEPSDSIIEKQPEWPTDERIDNIGQNGNTGEHYDKMSNLEMAKDLATPENQSELENCLDKIEQHGNYYDIAVSGKYDTGCSVIDPYRLFAALPQRLDSEIEHAIKKLLYAGQRGAKDINKDINEAIMSLEAWKERVK